MKKEDEEIIEEIILEEMRSKFDLVLECYAILHKKIDNILAELAKINRRLDEDNRLLREQIRAQN
jgi:hypothetical protein